MEHRTCRIAALACLMFASHAVVAAPQPLAERVDSILAKMTLDEKITLLGGVDDFFTRPIDRLGIPKIKMTDGPNGTRVFGKSTAYPAGMLLAATWDRELAQREGEQLGRDARARGCNVLLGPGMNLYRHPRCGRNFEYFGEDPLLSGEIATGYVRGVESQGVSATVKHFATNNQETDRDTGSTEADERTLREIYLASFRRVIEQGKPGAVMCAYNRINGTWCSENAWLLTTVLRDDWKFEGVVMSDWGAVHGTIGPINAGLDLEMPSPAWINLKNVNPLLASGVVAQPTIDTKVRRLLTWMATHGWLDHDITDSSIPQDNPDGSRVALDVAHAGITLLKNENNLLPLDKASVKHVVIVGPNAAMTPVGGGGSGSTDPFHSVSIVDGLRAALGDRVTVIDSQTMTTNLDTLAAAPAVDGGQFAAEFFGNTTLSGSAVLSRDVKTIDFDVPNGSGKTAVEGVKPHGFSARYRATITPDKTASYTFFTNADDGTRVLIDGKPLIDDWSNHQARLTTAVETLEGGKKHDVVIEYYDNGGAATLRFGCGPTPAAFSADELVTIKDADAVIACVGFNSVNESEGNDRSYALPGGQNDLIVAAAAANPKTVVLLNAGGSCDMTSWADHTQGLVHAYYAGQEGGTAIADVLLGNVNPSGHLPFTIEKQLADVPAEGHWGTTGAVEYTEGVFAGYRGYDHRQIEPRFPFGFGLSYTSFAVDHAAASVEGDTIHLAVEVANTGKRDGATVVQCYVEPPTIDLPRPVKELKAFAKVQLKAGEHKTAELIIPRADLAYWDVKTHGWIVTPGPYKLHVGFDSRDLPVTARVDVVEPSAPKK